MDNPPLANTFGTLGAVCWSIQLLPQIYLNWSRHSAIGLQPTMMMFWAWAGVPLGVYNIVSDFNIALQIQPQILAVLSLLTWSQCYYYEKKWSIVRSLAVVVPVAAVMPAIEVGLVFALRVGLTRGTEWPLTLMAVLAALFLALGVLRHYWDIYVHRTVRGISFLFVGIDALGDLTSIIAVLFQSKLDVLGLVIYGVELVLWIGVLAAGGYFNFIPWIKKHLTSRKSSDRSRPELAHGEQVQNVTLHDMPSSASVFRTPSSDMELRERSVAMGTFRHEIGASG
ncbi:hypothetical protein CLAFUW4_09294 [Fulvia fulva]|uniref:PQ loop repeat protein n=1 Tax=Passalora fulva TaxID=5499 RepID=A0A9Q8UTE9_PASFU|nr:uncharacterized protein CLAFUR5_09395 [Fulvia fulva]KAK4613838.1 hypothetical protein CLAFUR4_09300 [Fulvia fulva]UJO21879.1 hypothetical protein CLAFUR5_09395 [Fulvia fulva]WPV20299.1 hypothetical protein CLAFUW4_09294 [Fulvia fulva]WPV35193.1 hypothetical protein CLAFUW7_09295 [Fulvia fulva]